MQGGVVRRSPACSGHGDIRGSSVHRGLDDRSFNAGLAFRLALRPAPLFHGADSLPEFDLVGRLAPGSERTTRGGRGLLGGGWVPVVAVPD